jgi:hypothetical protein
MVCRASSNRDADTKVLGHQIGLPLLVLLREAQLGARDGDLGLHRTVARAHCRQIGTHLGQLGLGPGHRHLEGRRIDAEQNLAGGHGLILLDQHLLDRAGDLGADGHLVGLHVGVVGFDVAAAPEVQGGAH